MFRGHFSPAFHSAWMFFSDLFLSGRLEKKLLNICHYKSEHLRITAVWGYLKKYVVSHTFGLKTTLMSSCQTSQKWVKSLKVANCCRNHQMEKDALKRMNTAYNRDPTTRQTIPRLFPKHTCKNKLVSSHTGHKSTVFTPRAKSKIPSAVNKKVTSF